MRLTERNINDLPAYKEKIIAQLHGEFLGYIKAKGLKQDNEFSSKVQETFSCSKRIIHIWDMDKTKDSQIVVFLNSTQFMLEFGVYNKIKKEVTHRNKLENLRYKISDGEDVELIDSHQKKFDLLFEDFKKHFAVSQQSVEVDKK